MLGLGWGRFRLSILTNFPVSTEVEPYYDDFEDFLSRNKGPLSVFQTCRYWTWMIVQRELLRSAASSVSTTMILALVVFLVALYRAMRLRFGYGFESCDANGPRNVKNTNIAKHRPFFFPHFSLLAVGIGLESAETRAISRCDSL